MTSPAPATLIPVLHYHSISEDPPPWIAGHTVSPRAFALQLDQLADSGRTVIPLRRLVSALHGDATLPPDCAVLTFDDGYADFYWTVAPELQRRGLPATLFVTTGAVHPPGHAPPGSLLPPAAMLNWRQLATLDSCGFELGGHSVTHAQLDTLRPGRLRHETADCKRQLEDVLGHAVYTFAYPHGYSSPVVRRAVRAAGWSAACAGGDAISSALDCALRIARLTLRADTPPELFAQWLSGVGAPIAPLPESLRARAWRWYRRARAHEGRGELRG